MPEEVFVLFIFSILAFTTMMIIGMSLRYKSRKAERASLSSSSSLTTSELERMMQRAVKKATGPLEEKLEVLEEMLAASSGGGGKAVRQLDEGRKDLLADIDTHQTEEEEALREGRRVR